VLDPHPVGVVPRRDQADVDARVLDDAGVRRGERVEESPPHALRVVAPQALEIRLHDHRTELGHPDGIGEAARSKSPLLCHATTPPAQLG